MVPAAMQTRGDRHPITEPEMTPTELAADCFTHVGLGFVASAFLWTVGLAFAVARKAIVSAGSVE